MNTIEKQMTDILRTMREGYGAVAVKASMEAEGILLYEILRLKEIVTAAPWLLPSSDWWRPSPLPN